MKRLTIRFISYSLLLIFFFVLSFASIKQIRAQEGVEIPGPELEEASFIPVKDLKIGDWVFVKGEEGLVPERVTKLEYHQKEVDVYNLTVDGEETFFANDFAVHNKKGEHDTVCDAIAVQQLSKASSEIWEWGGCTPVSGAISSETPLCSTYSRAGFKGMFQYKRELMGANCPLGGQFGGGSKNLCLFGVPNFCTPFCGDSGMCRHCHPGRHVGCCGEQCPGPSCNCSPCSACNFQQAINETCGEMTCGRSLGCAGCLDRIGHNAPGNGIRFRTNGWCDEDEGCGTAVKISAPTGFVIKSIEFDVLSYMQYWNGDRKSKLALSRGMAVTDWCTNPFEPMATIWEQTRTGRQSWSSGKVNIGAEYIFLYFFSKGQYCCNDEGDCRTSWCKEIKDNFAEVTNLKVELVPINQKVSEVVTVLNSSQLYYSACGLSGVCNWHTCNRGTMTFSAGGVWSPEIYSWTSSGPWTYDWTLPEGVTGLQSLLARVQCSVSPGATFCPLGSREIVGPTGTIKGNVYRNDLGKCSGSDDSPSGWVVECGNSIYGYYEAAKTGDNSYQCRAADGSFDIPYGTYIVRFKTIPSDWKRVAGCNQDSVTINSTTPDPTAENLYLWQGVQAWFQTEEGDVHAEDRVNSLIPSDVEDAGGYFCLNGGGGTPGVVSYGNTYDFKPGDPQDDIVSEPGWLAEDDEYSKKSYEYLRQLLGVSDATADNFDSLGDIGACEDGICYSQDDAAISGAVPGDTKAVVVVNGNLAVSDNLTVPVGSSLVVIVRDDIDIDDGVTTVEGIFIAGSINTGASTDYPNGDNKLTVNGSCIAGSITLGRGVSGAVWNETNPTEEFLYRPDLIMNSHSALWVAPYTWRELAP